MISKLTAPILNWFDRHANPIALQEVRHILSLTRTMIVYGLLVLGLWISSCNSSGYSADSLPFFMIGAFGVVGVALFPAQSHQSVLVFERQVYRSSVHTRILHL